VFLVCRFCVCRSSLWVWGLLWQRQ